MGKRDKEIFMQPENKNKAFILGTRKTGCDLIILGGTIVMKVVWIGFLEVLAMKISIYVSRYLSINHSEKLRK